MSALIKAGKFIVKIGYFVGVLAVIFWKLWCVLVFVFRYAFKIPIMWINVYG